MCAPVDAKPGALAAKAACAVPRRQAQRPRGPGQDRREKSRARGPAGIPPGAAPEQDPVGKQSPPREPRVSPRRPRQAHPETPTPVVTPVREIIWAGGGAPTGEGARSAAGLLSGRPRAALTRTGFPGSSRSQPGNRRPDRRVLTGRRGVTGARSEQLDHPARGQAFSTASGDTPYCRGGCTKSQPKMRTARRFAVPAAEPEIDSPPGRLAVRPELTLGSVATPATMSARAP